MKQSTPFLSLFGLALAAVIFALLFPLSRDRSDEGSPDFDGGRSLLMSEASIASNQATVDHSSIQVTPAAQEDRLLSSAMGNPEPPTERASGAELLRTVAQGASLSSLVELVFSDRSGMEPEAVWTVSMLQQICSRAMDSGPARDAALLNVFKAWTLGPLAEVCGSDPRVWRQLVTTGESRLPSDAGGAAFRDADFHNAAGRHREAFLAAIKGVQGATSYFDLGFALANLPSMQDLAFEETSDARLILVNPGPLENQEIHKVLEFAHTLRFCQIHEGCGRRHPLLLDLCFRTGCDRDIASIDSVIFDVLSPREVKVLDQVMSLFFIDVDRFAERTAL